MQSFSRCIFLRHQLIVILTFLIFWLRNIRAALPKFSSDIKLCEVSASEIYVGTFFFLSHLVFTVLDLNEENVRVNCEVCTLKTRLQKVVKAVWCDKKCTGLGIFKKLNAILILPYFSSLEQLTEFLLVSDLSCEMKD